MECAALQLPFQKSAHGAHTKALGGPAQQTFAFEEVGRRAAIKEEGREGRREGGRDGGLDWIG